MSSSDKHFACEYCEKKFQHNFTLRRHVKNSHSAHDSPLCIATRRSNTTHVSADSKPPSSWLCNECSKLFDRRSRLCQHLLKQHPGQPLPGYRVRVRQSKYPPADYQIHDEFACAYCSKKFLYKRNLSSHVRTAHPGRSLPADGRSERFKKAASEKIELQFNNMTGIV